ncbi:MAG: hypothetical protein GXO48_01360 [Chlorobi bacterium]|nr:hypothetical protein [Chlorobiota bacterium]
MKQNSLSVGILMFIATAFPGIVNAQRVLSFQGFEGSPLDNWNYTEIPDSLIEIVSEQAFEGSKSLRLRGTVQGTTDTPTILFNNVSLNPSKTYFVSVAFAADGPDGGDDLFLLLSYDNGITWQDTIKLVDGYSNKSLQFGEVDPYADAYMNPYIHYLPAGVAEVKVAIRYVINSSFSSFYDYYFVDAVTLAEDTAFPYVEWAVAVSLDSLLIQFSEPLDTAVIGSIQLLNGPAIANFKFTSDNPSRITIKLASALQKGVDYKLFISGFADLAGFTMSPDTVVVGLPAMYDVVISEIFPDPSPPVGLPDCSACEFVEIYNRANYAIHLTNWTITNQTGFTATFPEGLLLPDQYLILIDDGGAQQYTQFGEVLAFSAFPYIHNTEGFLIIKDNQGNTIDYLEYDKSFYRNEVKAEGGWTLERIDLNVPCAGKENWRASVDPLGGTPGKPNSVAGTIEPITPYPVRAYVENDSQVVIVFSGPLPEIATLPSFYSFEPALTVVNAKFKAGRTNRVLLSVSPSLDTGIIYVISISGLTACDGTTINGQVQVAIPLEADSFDITINEVLFNAPRGGSEFVELYNRSSKTFDLRTLRIANTKCGTPQINFVSDIDTAGYLFFPGEYIVLTDDPQAVDSFYYVKYPEKMIRVINMPYLRPSSSCDYWGGVAVLTKNLQVIDLFNYSEELHHPLVRENDYGRGVSLEKINPDLPSNEPSSWQSAASTVGYATPTYQNSQYRPLEDQASQEIVVVEPEIFSPDEDGYNDYVLIKFSLPSGDFIAQVRIFNMEGKLVKTLLNNGLVPQEGFLKWDGSSDKGFKVPVGNYIVLFEAFNPDGETIRVMKRCVVATRLE